MEAELCTGRLRNVNSKALGYQELARNVVQRTIAYDGEVHS